MIILYSFKSNNSLPCKQFLFPEATCSLWLLFVSTRSSPYCRMFIAARVQSLYSRQSCDHLVSIPLRIFKGERPVLFYQFFLACLSICRSASSIRQYFENTQLETCLFLEQQRLWLSSFYSLIILCSASFPLLFPSIFQVFILLTYY